MGEKENKTEISPKGYLHEDFRVFHNTDVMGTDTPVHFHTFYKVTFVKYGKGTYMIDGRVYDIQSGDIILVGINIPHQPCFEEGDLYDRYTVYISEGMLQSFDVPECHISEIFSSESGNVIRPEKREIDRFVSMMERIEIERHSSSFASVLSSRILVIQFLIEAARCREESSLPVPLSIDDDDGTLAILRYINDSLSENISVEDIAAHFDTDSDSLATRFRDAIGCQIGEYITNRRLTRAREMIMQGAGPAQACYECGFESYREFTALYREKYGLAPKRIAKDDPEDAGFSEFLPE